MAVAKLSKAVLICPRRNLSHLLTLLCESSCFHPSHREGLVEDPEILLVSSRAHEVYSDAGELMPEGQGEPGGRSSEIRRTDLTTDIFSLVATLAKELEELREAPHPRAGAEGNGSTPRLLSLREAARLIFSNLRRIRTYPGLRRFVLIEGFIPSSMTDTFRRNLSNYLLSLEQMEKRGTQDPYVPSLLVNPRVISWFENITLSQGSPRYQEIDPTPLIAFIFPVFFGIMFADIGHGITLLLVGIALAIRAQRRYGYWGRVLTVLGVSSLAAGGFRGVLFGIELQTPWMSAIPLRGPAAGGLDAGSAILWLEVGALIGTFHLTLAYVIALFNRVRSGDLLSALLSHLPTLTFYSSAIPLALSLLGARFRWQELFISDSRTPVFKELLGLEVPVSTVATISFPIVVVSFAVLISGRAIVQGLRPRPRQGIVTALAEGLLDGLLRPIEFLANTISYVRLGVLLILGQLLGAVVGRALELGALGIPLVVVANMGVMALEGLIVYIQDMRLHLYEWFSKFYFGLGIPFDPLVSVGRGVEIRWLLDDPSKHGRADATRPPS